MDVGGFSSALKFTKVRDFAYHDRHPLHYGVREHEETEQAEPSEPTSDSHETGLPEGTHVGTHVGAEPRDARTRSPDDIYRRAVALFDFEPENSNETQLVEGQVVWISYRHGQGWLVAENLETGETGLVPEEYVQVLPESDEEWFDTN